jgi:hypothetical protein
MKKGVKFKRYKRFENISCVHFVSFYNLKRTKWFGVRNRLIKTFTRKSRKRFKFLNLARVKRENKFWGKIAYTHQQRNSFVKKVAMSHVNFFNKRFPPNKPRKYRLSLLQNIIKVLLKTEILLWVCGLFISPQASRVQLLSGNIYFNHNKVFNSVFIKQNDILHYKKPHANLKKSIQLSSYFLNTAIFKIKKLISKKYILKKKKRKFKLKTFFFQYKKKYSLSLSRLKKVLILKKKKIIFSRHVLSFLEVDLYSKSVVVIKDVNSMTGFDFCLAAKEYFDMQHF